MVEKSMGSLMRSWKDDTAKPKRIVIFGSSTSEQGFQNGALSWGSWLGASLECEVGRHVHTIIRGVGGDTVLELLARAERDVLSYRPDLVVLMIGGNDSDECRRIDDDVFRTTLSALCGKFVSHGIMVVMQTYFHPLLHRYPDERRDRFLRYMGYGRELAGEYGFFLFDWMHHFQSYYRADPDRYSRLFIDEVHLNHIGQTVAGYGVCKAFGLRGFEIPGHCRDEVRMHLDQLAIKYSDMVGTGSSKSEY